jgi:hypothetical protein
MATAGANSIGGWLIMTGRCGEAACRQIPPAP